MDEKLNFQNRIKTLYRKASQNPEGIIKNKNFSIRSSHQRCSMKNGVLRNFTKFTEKHLCQSFFFNKVVDLRSATLLKKGLLHRSSPVNFWKFLRTLFLQNTSGRLLLKFQISKGESILFY